MKNIRKRIVTSLFFCLLFLPTLNADSFADGTWTHYTSTYNIYDIAVKGNDLWYATDGGVVHRNVATGTSKKYYEENGLAENFSRNIIIDGNGIVWIIGRDNLSRFDGLSWERIPDGGRFNGDETLFLKIDSTGKIRICGYHFLWCYDGNNWSDIEIPEIYANFDFSDFTIDHEGGIWICANGDGIIHFNGLEWVHYSTENILPSNQAVKTITAYDGKVWIIFREFTGYTGYFEDGQWHIETPENGISSPQSITQTSDNKIWVGSFQKLNCFDGISWVGYDAKVVGLHNIVPDDSGNLWMTANQGGLASFDSVYWSFYEELPGLVSNDIRSLAITPDNKLWVGTEMGYSLFDGTNFDPDNSLLRKLSISRVDPIFVTSDGKVCMGLGGGIRIYDNAEWFEQYIVSNLAGVNTVMSIAESRDGTIWFGTIDGMYFYKDGVLSDIAFFRIKNFVNNDIYKVVSDKNGNIWAGTVYGVYFFDGNSWIKMGGDDPVMSRRVTSILITNENSVWIGGYGVARYDGENWTSYTQEDGFHSTLCYAMAQDSTGVMWFGGDEGVASFDGTTFHKFTESDGITETTNEGKTGNTVSNIVVSPSNEIWCSTSAGHFVYNNGLFKKIIVNGKDLSRGPVLFDKKGSAWVGTGFGLFKYTPEIIDAVENKSGVPELFEIKGNYPNPFNPNTTISFTTTEESLIEIAVYNIEGQKIKTLLSGVMSAGNHSSIWDGRNETGQNVSSGIYFARLKSGNIIENHKMLLLR